MLEELRCEILGEQKNLRDFLDARGNLIISSLILFISFNYSSEFIGWFHHSLAKYDALETDITQCVMFLSEFIVICARLR